MSKKNLLLCKVIIITIINFSHAAMHVVSIILNIRKGRGTNADISTLTI